MQDPQRHRHARDTDETAPGSQDPGPRVPGFPDATLEESLLVTPLALILMAYGFEPEDGVIIPDVADTWYGPLNVANAEKDGRAIVAFRVPGASADYLNGLRCVAALRHPGVQVDYQVAFIVLTGPFQAVADLWDLVASNGTREKSLAAFGAILREEMGSFEAEFQA